jgi:hypothetical protein
MKLNQILSASITSSNKGKIVHPSIQLNYWNKCLVRRERTRVWSNNVTETTVVYKNIKHFQQIRTIASTLKKIWLLLWTLQSQNLEPPKPIVKSDTQRIIRPNIKPLKRQISSHRLSIPTTSTKTHSRPSWHVRIQSCWSLLCTSNNLQRWNIFVTFVPLI